MIFSLDKRMSLYFVYVYTNTPLSEHMCLWLFFFFLKKKNFTAAADVAS